MSLFRGQAGTHHLPKMIALTNLALLAFLKAPTWTGHPWPRWATITFFAVSLGWAAFLIASFIRDHRAQRERVDSSGRTLVKPRSSFVGRPAIH